MKRSTLILFILLIGCKPDEPLPPFECHEIYIPLPAEYLSFINSFEVYQNFYYKNNMNSLIVFNNTGSFENQIYDTIENNCYKYDFKQFGAYCSAFNCDIGYELFPFFIDSNNFIIKIGRVGDQFGCESRFNFTISSIEESLDSCILLDKTFYNVYYRSVSQLYCCTEMYYNKQYGVVGFNWLGEWYVLETDSL